MSQPFNSRQGLIVLKAEATGPARSILLQLALDTAATTSVLSESILLTLGYDLANITDRAQLTTGGAVMNVPRVVLTRLSCLGRHRFGFYVVGHTITAAASVQGLLGLDFLRDHVLTIDFPAGQIDLL